MADIVAPAEQEGTKAVLKAWLKKPGDIVRVNDPVLELETDKVAVEIAATADGVLAEILIEEGADVEPGVVLGRISDAAAPSIGRAMEAAVAPSRATSSPSAKPQMDAQLPPGIRRLLEEHGLAASDVPVSGARLSREDILAEVERRAEAPAAGVTRVPHDSMRKRIAEHLTRSMNIAPHVTAVFEADFSAIAAHRAAHKNEFADAGANLTFTPYFVAASIAAMKAAQAVNGRWFDDRIEIYDDINIGIGTALGEKGLIVPVIHRAQSLSLLEIAKQLTDLTERARAGKLAQADVQGGTFSISNHGVSGSLIAAPIIVNQPQSAILGVGKLEKRAVVRGDTIQIRPMAYVTLTIDHRVIDAFQTNAWLSRFVETLEAWPLEG
ncbi:MAG TPA: 2-oxo acid dehydrogenase subunit E2 [Rhizomicrobium sp.]|jgi:2-oxoglutarate dehydrogenase E2 component (dihydrolipoamide succinyltransferase)|nr:2-oxo acid dehydrogenase subunit E2 [Rhizomicrobium sp.]